MTVHHSLAPTVSTIGAVDAALLTVTAVASALMLIGSLLVSSEKRGLRRAALVMIAVLIPLIVALGVAGVIVALSA